MNTVNDLKNKETEAKISLTRFILTYLALFAVIMFICFLLGPGPAKADAIIFPGFSHHVNTDVRHNPNNWGIGYEWQTSSGRDWIVEAYKNSYWKNSVVVMTEAWSYHFTDNLKFRVMAGGVTGYRYPVTPGAIPVWTYEKGQYGVDALTIPSLGGRMGIYAVQFKVRF